MKSPNSKRIADALRAAAVVPQSDREIGEMLDDAEAAPFGHEKAAQILTNAKSLAAASRRSPRNAWITLAAAAAVAVGLGITLLKVLENGASQPATAPGVAASGVAASDEMTTTHPSTKRRVQLDDGSILYIDHGARVTQNAKRALTLERGRIYLEVAPGSSDSRKGTFTVHTPTREITALGTRFALDADASDTTVVVTQGKVRASGASDLIHAGQQMRASRIVPVANAANVLEWTRELRDSADTALVPKSEFAGGAVVVKKADGQESRLSLRSHHVDVHIEDGFARTTIDQVYYNHMDGREEGTFYFPLPPDASISRLAMYVNGKLMEGGMTERRRARDVFETIKYRRKDPALLEWVDGSTFKMRVFPLEARSEKRIILSYTQQLANHAGSRQYRFPAGHNFSKTGSSSIRMRLKNGADAKWESGSHDFKSSTEKRDLVLSADGTDDALTRDVVLTLEQETRAKPRIATFEHEDHRYLLLRDAPTFGVPSSSGRRDWIFLVESSADRNALLARVQTSVLRTLLENAGHDDTFSIVTANTATMRFRDGAAQSTDKASISSAGEFLDKVSHIGALDLDKAFRSATQLAEQRTHPILVHLGGANACIGKRNIDHLLSLLPDSVPYVGVAVGKKWNLNLMHSAAAKTGGYVTQINPDESINWRAFQLFAALNTSRLVDIRVTPSNGDAEFLLARSVLLPGDELTAIARLPKFVPLPSKLKVTATLNGEAWEKEIPVGRPVSSDAGYLPRVWTKLEIDRLLAADSEANRDTIITLSKAMYVLSPFTSLLVLENDAMYAQYKVDRGRKDHWARYPAPLSLQKEPQPEVAENPAPTPTPVNPDAELTESELARRQAALVASQDDLSEGKRLMAEKDVEGAIGKFRSAIDRLPNTALTRNVRSQAVVLFSNACVDLAHERALEGRRESSRELLHAVLSDEVDPNHRRARKILVRLDDPEWYNWAITPEHVSDVKEVDRLLRVGRGYYDIGDFDNADKQFQKILRIDKSNLAARRNIEEVEIARQHYHLASRDHTRARMLRQVDEMWETSVPLVQIGGVSADPDSRPLSTEIRVRAALPPRAEPMAYLSFPVSVGDEPGNAANTLSYLGITLTSGSVAEFTGDGASLVVRSYPSQLERVRAIQPIFSELHQLVADGKDAGVRETIDALLENEPTANSAALWRIACHLAVQDGKHMTALECLERAVSLEHSPDTENVETDRFDHDYRQLFAAYLRTARALKSLEQRPPADLVFRVLGAAERWRPLSHSPESVCVVVADVLYALGEEKLAWQYLSTLAALRPNEAAPLLTIARSLETNGKLDGAETTYAEAFLAESSNPNTLLEHAGFLNRQQRTDDALELYRKVASGTWQPRFSNAVSTAKRALRSL